MKVILDSEQIEQILAVLTDQIVSDTLAHSDIAVIGIRSRGEVLAQRLAARLSEKLDRDIPCGTLDITLYRDDLNSPQGTAHPEVRTTEIGFGIDEKVIVLVDDVLYTGRTIRCALDELIDFGRPLSIQLAVFVDRGHRELPIRADYVGKNIPTAKDDQVKVKITEVDKEDSVSIIKL